MNSLIQKINDIRAYLNAICKEREAEIEGLLTGLVARQHVLLIGPPGSGKTYALMKLTGLIDGFQYFQWLMTKFTTPEELFGPYDLNKLKQGAYERITQGKLPNAHVVYLDEIWKSNSAILNSLLTLINERLFYNGTNIETCPLSTLVGSSNEYPTEEELQAAFDRFMFRYETGYIKDDSNFASMLLRGSVQPPASITMQELEQLQKQVEQVSVDQTVVDAIISLKVDLAKAGITISDRRWMQCVRQLLPARAVLAGRQHVVMEEDAEILQHALWESPSQRQEVAAIVRKRLDPLAGKIAELLEDAEDATNVAMKADSNSDVNVGTEAIKKLRKIRTELQTFIQAGGSQSKLEKLRQADAKVESMIKGVGEKCLGL